ncbi:MAG: glycosyltransferase [Patescibacteria group bacterium]
MKTPNISVIIPVHNGELFLYEALESLRTQSFQNFELIVINDASTDKTRTILDNYIQKKMKKIHLKKRVGVAAALNYGLRYARGEYIARMDADDIAYKRRLEIQIRFLNTHPKVGVVGSWVELIDGKGKLKGYKKFPTTDRGIKRMLHFANPLVHPSVVVRKVLFDQFGDYTEELDGAEDYELWCRFATHTWFVNLKHILLQQRLHAKNVSFSNTSRLNFAYARVQFRKVFKYGYPVWELVLGFKSLLSAFTPRLIQKWVYQKFFGY